MNDSAAMAPIWKEIGKGCGIFDGTALRRPSEALAGSQQQHNALKAPCSELVAANALALFWSFVVRITGVWNIGARPARSGCAGDFNAPDKAQSAPRVEWLHGIEVRILVARVAVFQEVMMFASSKHL